MRVVVYTSDSYVWCLRPFQYLFNTYWSELQPVLVGGFRPPPFALAGNFTFRSIAPRNYPAKRWSDGLIQLLNTIDDEVFIFMLEDYWLCRGVYHQAVASLEEYMKMHRGVLRIDLTSDRLYSGRAFDVDTWGSLDIIETPADTPYQWSTQACVVRREQFLQCLEPGMAPWQFELRGNELIPEGLRVLGTRQWPVRYVNAVGMQNQYKYRVEHDREGAFSHTIERIPPEHVDYMRRRGILPPNEKL